jgi:rubrerythrin
LTKGAPAVNILDNVLNTVAKEVSKVQTRSQEMLQQFNIQNQIRELKVKRQNKLADIGKMVYEKHENGVEYSEDALKEHVAEVSGIDHEIDVLQAEYDQIKINNDPDATPSQKAEAKAGYTASPGYTCHSCGAPANRERPFCPACGESIKNKNGTDEVEVEVEPDSEH